MHLLLSKFLVLQCYSFSEKIVLYTCTYFSSRTLFEFLSFFLKDSKNISPHNLGYRTGGRQAWLRVEHPSPHVTKNHLLTKPLKHPNFKGCGCSYYQYITAALCHAFSIQLPNLWKSQIRCSMCVFTVFLLNQVPTCLPNLLSTSVNTQGRGIHLHIHWIPCKFPLSFHRIQG